MKNNDFFEIISFGAMIFMAFFSLSSLSFLVNVFALQWKQFQKSTCMWN